MKLSWPFIGALVCISFAAVLCLHNCTGWGWFLFFAFLSLCCPSK